jgi:membrane-bound metal-dependent hydrolase YbcI (DUF457 family)
MPTPLGHAIAGLALYTAFFPPASSPFEIDSSKGKWLLLAVTASLLPDIDFIHLTDNGALAISGAFHRGVTHTIGFAAAGGAITALIAWMIKTPQWKKTGAVVGAGLCSHLLLDLLNIDENPVNGLGLPLFWPVLEGYYMIPLLPGVDRSDPLSVATLCTLCAEIALIGALYGVSILLSHRRTPPVSDNK